MNPEPLVILVPVLDRPNNVIPLLVSIGAATGDYPHRVIFLISEGDKVEQAAVDRAGAAYVFVPAPGTWAQKINVGYRLTDEPLLFAGADDLRFHRYWLDVALDVMAEAEASVIGTNDICNPRTMTGVHSTHSLFRRSYIDECGGVWDEPGTVLFEGYPHEYADDEFVETAKARGVYAHAFGSIVEHLHPLCGKAEDDATYRKGREHTAISKRLFLTRRRALWDPRASLRRR